MSIYENGVLKLTRDEWKRKHKDFKSTRLVNGHRERTALYLVPGVGTCSVPVVMIEMTKKSCKHCGGRQFEPFPAPHLPIGSVRCLNCGEVKVPTDLTNSGKPIE